MEGVSQKTCLLNIQNISLEGNGPSSIAGRRYHKEFTYVNSS